MTELKPTSRPIFRACTNPFEFKKIKEHSRSFAH